MRFRKKRWEIQQILLAPMVDILFVLLLFFIVTTSYQAMEKELSIALPEADHSSEIEQSGRDVLINITKQGTYVISRKEYTLEELRELLMRTKEVLGTRAVLIRADMATMYDSIVRVMDLCAELNIVKISFVTKGTEAPPA